MIIEIISFIVFAVSVAGFIGIVTKKMPKLAQIQGGYIHTGSATAKQEIKDWFKFKLKSLPYLKDFSWLDLAQKTLLKIRLVALKAENKINDYMVRLRQVADDERKKDEVRLDNYWRELKTIVKGKNPLYKRDVKTSVVELEMPVKDISEESEAHAKLNLSEKASGSGIRRVVTPESTRDIEKSSRRRRGGNKKKNNKDPFQW